MQMADLLKEYAADRYRGLSFDQLNTLYDASRDRRSMDYKDYFGEMYLSDSQKEQRIDTAQRLEDVFKVLLGLVFYYYTEGEYEYADAIAEAQDAYRNILAGAAVSDYYTSIHIPDAVNGVVNTMLANPEDPFNFSLDRAILIAENEANSVWNDAEYEEALRSGKKRKTWHAIIDKGTRDWHREANGQTKPITEPFEVGGDLMQYPRDESLGAGGENIVNCRCSATYS